MQFILKGRQGTKWAKYERTKARYKTPGKHTAAELFGKIENKNTPGGKKYHPTPPQTVGRVPNFTDYELFRGVLWKVWETSDKITREGQRTPDFFGDHKKGELLPGITHL